MNDTLHCEPIELELVGLDTEGKCSACKGAGTLEIEDCPNCDNCGWYMVPDSDGEPTPEECQWCYTVANSRFNKYGT